jgi:hypothetical protein
MEETACSNEQYRIQKMVDGKNNVSYQDAMDEEIDNALDAEATKIIATFEDDVLRKLYNNGRPMCSKDRVACLTLDGKSDAYKNNTTIKGRYGIGAATARARLAGQGLQRITSKDNENVYQCDIKMKELCNEDFTGINNQPWSQNNRYRPKFNNISHDLETVQKYKNGVTKEYTGKDLKQRFHKETMIIHLVQKYHKQISNGLQLDIDYDGQIYNLPLIYNYTEDIETITVTLDTYKGDEKSDRYILFNFGDRRHIVKKISSGALRCDVQPNRLPSCINNQNITNSDTVYIRIPITKHKSNDGYEYINENAPRLFKNLELNQDSDSIKLNCGENNLDLSSLIDKEKKDKNGINRTVRTVLENLKRGISITQYKYVLTTFDLDFDKRGGDFDKQQINKAMFIELNLGSETDMSQENKNIVNLPKDIQKAIKKIVEIASDNTCKKSIIKKPETKDIVSQLSDDVMVVDNTPPKEKPSNNIDNDDNGDGDDDYDHNDDDDRNDDDNISNGGDDEDDNINDKDDDIGEYEYGNNVVDEIVLHVSNNNPSSNDSSDESSEQKDPRCKINKRNSFSDHTQKLAVEKQTLCPIFGLDLRDSYGGATFTDFDHKDGVSSNNEDENCNPLSILAHRIKSKPKSKKYYDDLLNSAELRDELKSNIAKQMIDSMSPEARVSLIKKLILELEYSPEARVSLIKKLLLELEYSPEARVSLI